jgi:hypothetical protein
VDLELNQDLPQELVFAHVGGLLGAEINNPKAPGQVHP